MSEHNKQVVRELWGCVQSGDFDKMASLYDANVKYHGSGGERQGREAAVDLARGYKDAFPDMTITIESMIAEGDRVFSMVRPRGTNTGELMGMPPTGKSIDIQWIMNVCRIDDGKVVEEWEVFDEASFMKQLGMAPE